MPNAIDVSIAHRNYKMMVEPDQEARLQRVAAAFNQRIDTLRTATPDMERDRLLVLAAMMLADDLLTTTTEKTQLEKATASFNQTLATRLNALCD